MHDLRFLTLLNHRLLQCTYVFLDEVEENNELFCGCGNLDAVKCKIRFKVLA